MTLNLRLYESQQQEEKSKPISRYPIPYKKDLPFDILELMEETEKKVRHSPHAEEPQPVQTFVGWSVIPGTGRRGLPQFPLCMNPSFGVPSQKNMHFFLLS